MFDPQNYQAPSTQAFVTFETRAVEDSTQQDGKVNFKDQDIAILLIPGTKDTVEKLVTDDLLAEWKLTHPARARAYEAFKSNKEAPIEGHDLRNWPMITPAQIKEANYASIRSVEDLAHLTDGILQHLPIGFLGLREKARQFLQAGSDIGAVVQEITNLKAKLESQQDEINRLYSENESLARRLGDSKPSKSQKNRKDDD